MKAQAPYSTFLKLKSSTDGDKNNNKKYVVVLIPVCTVFIALSSSEPVDYVGVNRHRRPPHMLEPRALSFESTMMRENN